MSRALVSTNQRARSLTSRLSPFGGGPDSTPQGQPALDEERAKLHGMSGRRSLDVPPRSYAAWLPNTIILRDR